MTTTHRTKVLLLLSTVAIAGLVYWYSGNSADQDPDRSPAPAATEESHTAPSSEPPQPDGVARFASRSSANTNAVHAIDFNALPPMPPADVPLAEATDVLLQRAEAGDPEASCRLILDVGACMEHRISGRLPSNLSQLIATTDNDRQREQMINVIAANENASARMDAFCAGTTPMNFSDMERLLNQALPRMSNRQRLLFTMSSENGSLIRLPRHRQMFSTSRTSDGIISQFHADNDLAALEQGIREADPLALEGKILLHFPTSMGKDLTDLREALPDPYTFAGYALMMQQLYGQEALGDIGGYALNMTLKSLDATTQDRLQQQVDAAVARWREVSRMNPKTLPDSNEQRSSSLCSG